MDILALVREVGIPLALLIAAVIALWRAWRLECKLRQRDLSQRCRRLAAHEDELFSLYRQLALRELGQLVDERKSESGLGND